MHISQNCLITIGSNNICTVSDHSVLLYDAQPDNRGQIYGVTYLVHMGVLVDMCTYAI